MKINGVETNPDSVKFVIHNDVLIAWIYHRLFKGVSYKWK